MTAIKYILKNLLKLAALPVILTLRIAMLLTKIVGYVGSYIMSPVMLFILGCGIYCLVKTRWTDVATAADSIDDTIVFFNPVEG